MAQSVQTAQPEGRRFSLKPLRMSRVEWREIGVGLLFASPWIIGFVAFTAIPLLSSLYYSFTRYDVLGAPVFIGIRNYVNLFGSEDFHVVIYNTLWWVLISSPLGVISAFLMALLLNTDIVARSAFHAIYFFPAIVPVVVVAFIWQFLLNIQYGAINATLQAWGFQTIPFLSNPSLVKPSLVLVHMWMQGAAMVIFLATLQDVPRSLYEAATVDGANSIRRLWHVTIPMVSPVILFNLVLSLISGFQFFILSWLLVPQGAMGGPNKSALFYAIYLYQNAFVYLQMGKASALAWILFLVVLLFTFGVFKASGRLVYYGGR